MGSRNSWLLLALSILVLAMGYLGFQFASFLGYSLLYPRLVRNRAADWVVVLGSGLAAGSRVTPLLAARIRTGMREAARHGARVLIMSGGKGTDERVAEAEAMGAWAIENGVDPQRILLETESRTTEENLRLTGEVVRSRLAGQLASGAGPSPEPSTVDSNPPDPAPLSTPSMPEGLIVTSSYHVMRAALLARRLHLPAQACGAPTARYYWPSAIIREYVAVLAEHPRLHLIVCAVIALPLPLAFGAVTTFG